MTTVSLGRMTSNPAVETLQTNPAVEPRQQRYRSLDMWRGVACLLVIIYHAALVHQGYNNTQDDVGSVLLSIAGQGNIGVPIFFVISGYCIAASSDTERRKRQGVRSYFIRRFRRIFPPYWVMFFLLVAFHYLVDYRLFPSLLSSGPWAQLRPWWSPLWSWIGNLTLTENWREHVIGGAHHLYPAQNWTLCYEEQFYAIMGLLLFLARRYFYVAVSIVTILVGVTMTVASRAGFAINGFFFDGSWLTFAAGILVYYWIHYADRKRRFLLAAILIGATIWAMLYPKEVPGGRAAFWFSFILLLFHRWDGAIASSRLVRPLAWCGTMCYSLYLVHQIPVKAVSQGLYWSGVTSSSQALFIVIPCCVVVSVILGYIFYFAVERHFLNNGSKTKHSVRQRSSANTTLDIPYGDRIVQS